MTELPPRPVSASEFFERFLPKAFTEAGLGAALAALDVPLGVRLEGRGGGEWLFALHGERLRVERGSRAGAAFTMVQSVEDWRGALWEGRGGAIGRQASQLFRPASDGSASRVAGMAAPLAAALGPLRELSGLLRVALTGGKGGDWVLAVMLGSGEIPAEATTTVSLRADDADALLGGELNPLEAFMGGRVQIAGDVGLLLQIQAIQMQAADNASSRRAG